MSALINGIETFFVNLFGGNPATATFFISMLPIIELRGAIPFGVSEKLWGAAHLTHWQALLFAVAGNILVAAVVLALLIPVFKLLKKSTFFARFINFFEERFQRYANKIEDKNKTDNKNKIENKKMFAIFIFTAIPLPMTGVWTGSAVAVFLGLGFFQSLLAVSAGALVSGLIMVTITILFGSSALSIFYLFCFVAVVILAGFFAVALFKKPKEKQVDISKS